MRRVLVLSLTAAALALSGCSGGGEGSLDSPSDSSSKPDKSEKSEKITAADGDDYDACRDGKCEVEVRESVTIPLDEKFEVTKFEVTVKNGKVTARVDSQGGHSQASMSGEGAANLQGFMITAPLITDDIAVVNIDHQG